MSGITIRPAGKGYVLEHGGRRSAYVPHGNDRAVDIVVLALARAPRPLTPAEAREALDLDDLPAFQRRWKSRVIERLAPHCPALADELRERLSIGPDVIAFTPDGAFGPPVRVVGKLFSVPKSRQPRGSVTVVSTSKTNFLEVPKVRVLTLIPCVIETADGAVVVEAGGFFDCTDEKLLAEKPDWLIPVRDLESEADASAEYCLSLSLQDRLRPWGAGRE